MVALDFMENLIDQNRASNAHFGNIDFRWGMWVLAQGDSCAGGLGGVAGGRLEQLAVDGQAPWPLLFWRLEGLSACTVPLCLAADTIAETQTFLTAAASRLPARLPSACPAPPAVPLCPLCRCGDAMELSLPEGSCDVAFSNWLLMYLGDAEVAQLARNMLGWVRASVCRSGCRSANAGCGNAAGL